MKKTSITSGQYALRAFDHDGLMYGANPIRETENYGILNVIANKEYTWVFNTIGHDVIPISLFGFKTTGVANADDFFIRVRDSFTSTLLWELNIKNNKTILGNAFSYVFPFTVVSQKHNVSVLSTVALDNVIIYGTISVLNPTIPPQY